MESVHDLANGRWHSILPALGVEAKHLRNKHGPCPICGGTDRYRFDDKDGRGTWFCNRCGAGNGVDLVMRLKGCSFLDAVDLIRSLAGVAAKEAPKRKRTEEEIRKTKNDAWRFAVPVQRDDPVGCWLAYRAGVWAFPSCLRTHMRAMYWDGGKRSFHPAMMAMVTGPHDLPVNIHRTFLTLDGRKANVPSPRMAMEGPIPSGSAIRLAKHDAVLGVAEGIETAFAAMALFGVPVWSTMNSGLLKTWEPPAGVTDVIVFGDHDLKFGGQAAAMALAHRLACDGANPRTVRLEIPPRPGDDWNDVWMRQHAGASREGTP
jgi:putative DNA primase/helicase